MTERVIAVIPARLDSTRLPRKQLRTMNGKPMIDYLLNRMETVSIIEETVVATSSREIDDPLEEWSAENDIGCYRGNLKNVLERLAETASAYHADIVVRANGDNPLLSPEATLAGVELVQQSPLEYVTGKNMFTGLPVGLGPGIIRTEVLRELNDLVECSYHKEHVTTYIFENHSEFSWDSIPVKEEWRKRDLSVTVDTPTDFDFVERIIEKLPENGASEWSIEDIITAAEEVDRNS